MDIAEFLLARIAEDEAAARAATPGSWGSEFGGVCLAVSPFTTIAAVADLNLIGIEGYTYGPELEERANADHIARWDPARVLAECEAKRRIVTEIYPELDLDNDTLNYEFGATRADPEDVLRLLALPYADHPDYKPEWSPPAKV